MTIVDDVREEIRRRREHLERLERSIDVYLVEGAIDERARTAAAYRLALELGRSPRLAVAELYGITPNAAAKRIQRARAAGALGPTRKGRKSA